MSMFGPGVPWRRNQASDLLLEPMCRACVFQCVFHLSPGTLEPCLPVISHCVSPTVSQLSASLFSNCVSTGTLEHLGTLSPTVSPSCLSIVSRSYPYCFSIVSQVYFWCFPLVSRLFHTCLPTVSHCLSIVSSLPPCYFSTVSHFYPACLHLSTP